MSYPVTFTIEPVLEDRNRLTTAFRLFLAIPHLFLVGGFFFTLAYVSNDRHIGVNAEWGLIGVLVLALVIVSWFTILISGEHLVGVRQFTRFYMGWRARAMAYTLLLTDAYPPFGDGSHPASVQIADPVGPRARMTVAFRLFMAIPHYIVLTFILVALCFTTVISWFAILLTGTHPAGLYEFAVSALRWRMRVDSYVLLMTDDYPPFSFD